MREAVGGSMLFYFVLIFIFVYIVFIGVIMNYAATYRASNYVVTTLEETEGNVVKSDLVEDLKSRHYYNPLTVCCSENKNGDAIYKVTTVVNFEIPFMGIYWTLDINNETKAIYGEGCNVDYECNQ